MTRISGKHALRDVILGMQSMPYQLLPADWLGRVEFQDLALYLNRPHQDPKLIGSELDGSVHAHHFQFFADRCMLVRSGFQSKTGVLPLGLEIILVG